MNYRTFKILWIVAVVVAILPFCVKAQTAPAQTNGAGVPLDLAVLACTELKVDTDTLVQMFAEGAAAELTYSVVVDNPVLSMYQRWVMAQYLLAVYLYAEPGFETTDYFPDFLQGCASVIGGGVLDVTPEKQRARDDSRRPV